MNDLNYAQLPDVDPSKASFYLTPNNQLNETLYEKSGSVVKAVNDLLSGYMYTPRGRKDHSIYAGYSGLALTHFLIYKKTKSTTSFEMAKNLTDIALTKLTGVNVSFLTGDAGPLALGTVMYALENDIDRSSDLRLWLLQLGQNPSVDVSCALIDGWAGYLYALLFVNKHLPDSIPTFTIRKVVSTILLIGVTKSIGIRSPSPLVFEWKGLNYLGPLYGLCGILHTLLCSEVLEESEIYNIIRPTLDNLLTFRTINGNFPPIAGSVDDSLIQWCHGSPGFAALFVKASEVVDPSYLMHAVEAGESTWKYGLLFKGYTLCHGIAGNAYSFLTLYKKTRERKYLMRAASFFEWCFKSYPKFEKCKPDRPYSLFKGYTGLLYFCTDMKDINTTSFPGYDL